MVFLGAVKNYFSAKSLPNQPSMRTRHRPRNKSVLQSAIARKERSLRVDDQPKQRPRRIKPKPLGNITYKFRNLPEVFKRIRRNCRGTFSQV